MCCRLWGFVVKLSMIEAKRFGPIRGYDLFPILTPSQSLIDTIESSRSTFIESSLKRLTATNSWLMFLGISIPNVFPKQQIDIQTYNDSVALSFGVITNQATCLGLKIPRINAHLGRAAVNDLELDYFRRIDAQSQIDPYKIFDDLADELRSSNPDYVDFVRSNAACSTNGISQGIAAFDLLRVIHETIEWNIRGENGLN